ncbi:MULTISPECIES: ribokinase [Corynebacterium]|uniref:Ribokinase n=1 Tax=Corynebacterium gottingense TaxID=2041036 RepID=A0ABX9UKU3_9CORY|nr:MULTISPECIES: ribokinase [Corynebacterium]PAT08328.1 ribokinase [Corynebacterium hadale]RMD20074.1 ribokinase [Corynebacterium gottingense]WJZ13715.1 Ribokinase [Corynebacterium gottingense]WJZ16030.1 Ribokinase [Corynebacterium gottingense]
MSQHSAPRPAATSNTANTTATADIVVVGSVNADLTVNVPRHPEPGETLLGSGGGITAGGKGANQACAAAKLGGRVALVGAVGRDANATPATALMREAGVNLDHLEDVDDVTGLAVITVAADGENTVLVIPGANALVDATFVRAHRAPIEQAPLVLLQGEIPADGFAEAVKLAHGRVVINLAPVVDVPRDALLTADPLLANEHEAGLILAQLGLDGSGTPPELAQRLLDAGVASVVLTLGAAGALVADADGLRDIASPRVTAVDTVGAGDSFAGALCFRLVAGDSLDDAAAYAARVGAFSVQRPGAQPSYPNSGDELPGAAR